MHMTWLVFALAAAGAQANELPAIEPDSEPTVVCAEADATVSNDARVWQGNQGKAFGPYMEFELAGPPRTPEAEPAEQALLFDVSKSTLRREAAVALESMAMYLQSNPEKTIVLRAPMAEGETEEARRALARQRLRAVRDYLRAQGVENPVNMEVAHGGEADAPRGQGQLERRVDVELLH
jgi:outer membrane protein OmpA-like peptidoglycan-associated protein